MKGGRLRFGAVLVASLLGGCGRPPAEVIDAGDAGAPRDASATELTAVRDAQPADAVPGPVVLTGAAAEAALACQGGTVWSLPAADAGTAPGVGQNWSQRFGDPSNDQATALAVGGDGTLFLGSGHPGSVDFGDGPVAPQSCPYFLSAFSSSGAHRWSRSFNSWVEGVAVGADGGPFAVLPNGPIISFAPDGGVRWVRQLPGASIVEIITGSDAVFSLSVGNLGFSTAPVTIERLSPSGEAVWSFAFAVSSGVPLAAAAPGGGLYFALWFYGTQVIADRTFESRGGGDLVVGKLDVAGNLAWVRQFGSPDEERVVDLVASASGGLVLLGNGPAALDFGTGPLGSGGWVGFLARLDDQGVPLSARAWTTSGDVGTWLREMPGSGQLLIGSNFSEAVDVGGTTLHTGASGDVDLLLVETDASLAVQRLWHFGNGGGDQELEQLAVDPTGAMILSGNFQGKLDLGSGILQSAGSFDVFLAKVNP